MEPPVAGLTYSKVNFAKQDEYDPSTTDRTDAPLEEANVINSLLDLPNGLRYHKILLDVDVRAKLIPSSTKEHSHLYIDIAVPEEYYFELLDVLVKCGVLQPGYVGASKSRGHTSLRLPWVKKGEY